jgi:predicted nucleic acid-binding protein
VRLVLDACVLFPPVMREMLLGVAGAGGFEPLWSARILEEWARAARRLPEGAEAAVRAEIVRLRAAWPAAEWPADADLEASLSLPDPDDRHVLATAIAGRADALLTLNRADFPPRTLARYGILLRDPDGLLYEIDAEGLDLLPVAEAVRTRAGRGAGVRQLLKRAGLPRLGKALAARQAGS